MPAVSDEPSIRERRRKHGERSISTIGTHYTPEKYIAQSRRRQTCPLCSVYDAAGSIERGSMRKLAKAYHSLEDDSMCGL